MTTPMDGSSTPLPGLREALIIADSVTSLIAHRHAAGLPDDLRRDLLDVSAKCRGLADQIKPGMVVVVCRGEGPL